MALNPVAGLHEYVVAPFAVNAVDCPEQIKEFPLIVTTGTELLVTVMVCDEVVQPFELQDWSVIVFVPAVLKHTPGFCEVEVEGVPLAKVQFQLVGEPVLRSVREIHSPRQMLLSLTEKFETGGTVGVSYHFAM